MVSLIYAMIDKLWLPMPGKRIAWVQYVLHIVPVIVLSSGLLLYGGVYAEAMREPILIPSTNGVLLGMLLLGWMVLRAGVKTPGPAEPPAGPPASDGGADSARIR